MDGFSLARTTGNKLNGFNTIQSLVPLVSFGSPFVQQNFGLESVVFVLKLILIVSPYCL